MSMNSPIMTVSLVLINFIILVIFLTIFWRVSSALDLMARSLSELAKELKKIAEKSGK
ncbi:MAG TPA: hypothetical protein VL981_03700 [Candidatus Methylacidiphilales bacterium]|nr:hypothetical protein [Candidatus Methylacidiphilales bacterium]